MQQIWEPITCSSPNCKIIVEIVDVGMTFVSFVSRCETHKEIEFDNIWSENKIIGEFKREVFDKMASTRKVLTPEQKEIVELVRWMDGNEEPVPDETPKPGVKYTYTFNEKREFVPDISMLTQSEKDLVQTIVESKFKDKVKLDA